MIISNNVMKQIRSTVTTVVEEKAGIGREMLVVKLGGNGNINI